MFIFTEKVCHTTETNRLEHTKLHFESKMSQFPVCVALFTVLQHLVRSWRMFADKLECSMQTTGNHSNLLAIKVITEDFGAALYTAV